MKPDLSLMRGQIRMSSQIILQDIRDNAPCQDLTADIPDFACAYAIQDVVVESLAKDLGGVAGYKIAWNSPAQIAAQAPNAPAVGCVFSDYVQNSGVTFAATDFAQLVVEPEIIAVIGADITDTGQTADSVRPQIAGFYVGFEIMERRNTNDTTLQHPPSILANNIFNHGLVLGDVRHATLGNIADMETVLNLNDAEIFRNRGAAPQDPAEAVAFIANNLASRGKNLCAGDLILCGTHFPPFTVKRGARLHVQMGGLGDCGFTFG